MEANPEFDSNLFKMLLVRPDIDHIFLSDVQKILKGIEKDFPEIARLTSLGQTWENRDIHLLTLDASGIFSSMPGSLSNSTAEE